MSAIALKYGAFDLQTDKITTTDTDVYSRNDQNLWIPGGRTFPEDDLQGIENSDQDQRANAGGKVRPCSR